jgi:hypothetical protein
LVGFLSGDASAEVSGNQPPATPNIDWPNMYCHLIPLVVTSLENMAIDYDSAADSYEAMGMTGAANLYRQSANELRAEANEGRSAKAAGNCKVL